MQADEDSPQFEIIFASETAMERKVWFQLMDAETRRPYQGLRLASVLLSGGVRDIEDVRAKIHAAYDRFRPPLADVLTHIPPNRLAIYESREAYADKNSAPLDEDVPLDEVLGGSEENALIVEVRKADPVIPPTTPLDDQEKIAEECSSFDGWSVDTVHEMPTIWRFMSELGGCTETGKVFWRLEDKQVVSLITDGWFQKSTPDNCNARANNTSVLEGSPGIGKSTLLCLMAFYLVFKHKKNVFLYRRVVGPKKGNSLLFMTHDADQVVYFAIPLCTDARANKIYKALARKIGAENVWALLDGFPLDQIRRGVWELKMIATSQHVDLKSDETLSMYCCLLPSWSKADLMALGRSLYKFEEDEMETRFYYSGGSVRDFTMDTVDDIRRGVDYVVGKPENVSLLVSSRGSILSWNSQFECLHRNFVGNSSEIDQFISPRHWALVIDSEYALRTLAFRLCSEGLFVVRAWPRGAGLASLAGCALEMYIHSLAAESRLRLRISKFAPLTAARNLEQPMENVEVQHGGAVKWGTARDYESGLRKWKDISAFTYWVPDCDNFPNIDSIVKLKSASGKKSNVAYLQITGAKKHESSAAELTKLNDIFFPDDVEQAGDTDPPLYIALCSSRAACEEFELTSGPEVVAAQQACPDQVYVGYYEVHYMASRSA